MPIGEYVYLSFSKEIIDVCNISSQEVKSVRMIMFDRLRNINHIYLILIVEHVVLTQICMDELAFLIQNSHDLDNFKINFTPSLNPSHIRISQSWSINHVLTQEIHHKNIRFNQQSYRTIDNSLHSLQISQLFLRPHTNHLSRIARTITSPKSELTLYVTISIFKDQYWCFVYFYCIFFLGNIIESVIDISFFTCRDTTVDLCDDLVVEKLEKNSSCSFIEDLFNSCTICLILLPFLFCELLLFAVIDLICYFMKVDFVVELSKCVFMVSLDLWFWLLILFISIFILSLLVGLLVVLNIVIVIGVTTGVVIVCLRLEVGIEVTRIFTYFQGLLRLLKHT